MEEQFGSLDGNPAMEYDIGPVFAVELCNSLTENHPAILELSGIASMEVHRPPLSEYLHAAASMEELPAAASMEIRLPPAALMEEHSAPAPAAATEVHSPSSMEEFPAAAALTEVQRAASMAPVDVDDPNYLSSFPKGYRFQPYDHELIIDYLKPKIAGKKLPPNRIHEINLSQYNPEQLAGNEAASEGECYFFTTRDKKYKTGARANRSASDGFWKATGTDTPVMHGGLKLGSRKALAFYRGKYNQSRKTNWIMHECVVHDPSPSENGSIDSSDMTLDDWVLCRIFKKSKKGPSRRHNYMSVFKNRLAAELEANGEQDPSHPMEVQSDNEQETISLTGGQKNVQQDNSALIEVQSHGGQRDNGPIQGQNIFIQGISSPTAVQNNVGQGSGLLVQVQNQGGQKDNGPMEAQNVFCPMVGQNNLWQETIMSLGWQVNSLNYPFNQLAPQPTTNYRQTLPIYPNPQISHPHAQQIQGSNGLSYFNQAHQTPQFMPQVPYQYGNQVLNWQAQSHNINELYAPQIHQPRQQLVLNNDTQQFQPDNPNHDILSYRMFQNNIHEVLPGPLGNFDELKDLQCNYIPDYGFEQGITRPMIGQNNLEQETIINPNYCGQVSSIDYPFNKLAPQLTTNYRQILTAYPNPPISHPHTEQIHGSNSLSCFNQAHQTFQFVPQVPHQYGNEVSNWQAQSHNFSDFYAPQIHQPRQQLVLNDDTQQFHPNNPDHDMLPYRLPQNDINGVFPGPSRNFGELEDLQCNYMPNSGIN